MKNGSETISTDDKRKEKVIKDLNEFHLAAATAHLSDEDYLIVDERIFQAVGKGVKTNYLTYGDPGIKVYLEGTKEKCDKADNRKVD